MKSLKHIGMSLIIAIGFAFSGCDGESFTINSRTFIDIHSGLEWQDDIDTQRIVLTLDDAKTYCSYLMINGYNDWFLPSINDMSTIFDYDDNYQDGFVNAEYFEYWTSSKEIVYDSPLGFPFHSSYPISYDGRYEFLNESGSNLYH